MTIIWGGWTKKKRGKRSTEPRSLPTAEFAPCESEAAKPIILRTCSGDCRLTPDEARRLAGQLDAAQREALIAEYNQRPSNGDEAPA